MPRLGPNSSQHGTSLQELFFPHLVREDVFLSNASFEPVNMKAIPATLSGFDFCWSSCSLEHLGGLQEGFDFIEASLDTLKPGGVAVHTTEFNLSSAVETPTSGPTVAYREKDVLEFVAQQRRKGHACDLNLNPGDHTLDTFVDRYLFGDPTLRFYLDDRTVATSLGLFIRKACSSSVPSSTRRK